MTRKEIATFVDSLEIGLTTKITRSAVECYRGDTLAYTVDQGGGYYVVHDHATTPSTLFVEPSLSDIFEKDIMTIDQFYRYVGNE